MRLAKWISRLCWRSVMRVRSCCSKRRKGGGSRCQWETRVRAREEAQQKQEKDGGALLRIQRAGYEAVVWSNEKVAPFVTTAMAASSILWHLYGLGCFQVQTAVYPAQESG